MFGTRFITPLICSLLLLGCVPLRNKTIGDLDKRQDALEAEVQRLSRIVEADASELQKREAETRRIQEGLKKSDSELAELKKRFDKLEKKQTAQMLETAKSADALFQAAESYYKEGKFSEAVLAYQRFIDSYHKDNRVPGSYLKQGLSLINIGRKNEARFFLQTVIDKFPESKEAVRAREKLKEINGRN